LKKIILELVDLSNKDNKENLINNSSIDDPLEYFDKFHEKLYNYINNIYNNKKGFTYKFIVNCYRTMKEIEEKIEEEKLNFLKLLDDTIQNEKIIYNYEVESNIQLYKNR